MRAECNWPMSSQWSRREILRGFAAIPAVILTQPDLTQSETANADNPQLEVHVIPVSDHTLRLTLYSTSKGSQRSIPEDGSLVQESWGTPLTTLAADAAGSEIVAYIEPVAVGDALPDRPIFLTPNSYVNCPLEETYQATWSVFPAVLKPPLEDDGAAT